MPGHTCRRGARSARDWGGAVVGDPIYELARTVAGGPVNDPRTEMVLPTLLDAYVVETGIDRVRLDRTLPLYQAHNAICFAEWSGPFAEWSGREGTPWIERQLAAARG